MAQVSGLQGDDTGGVDAYADPAIAGLVVLIDVSNIRVDPSPEDRQRRKRRRLTIVGGKTRDDRAQMFDGQIIERVYHEVHTQFENAVVIPIAGSSFGTKDNWIGDGYKRHTDRLSIAVGPRWSDLVRLKNREGSEHNDNIIIGVANLLAESFPDLSPIIVTNDLMTKLENTKMHRKVSRVSWGSYPDGSVRFVGRIAGGFPDIAALVAAAGVMNDDQVDQIRTEIVLWIASQDDSRTFRAGSRNWFNFGKPKRKTRDVPLASTGPATASAARPRWVGGIFNIHRTRMPVGATPMVAYGILRHERNAYYLKLGTSMRLKLQEETPDHLIDSPVYVVGSLVRAGDDEMIHVTELDRFSESLFTFPANEAPRAWSLGALAEILSRNGRAGALNASGGAGTAGGQESTTVDRGASHIPDPRGASPVDAAELGAHGRRTRPLGSDVHAVEPVEHEVGSSPAGKQGMGLEVPAAIGRVERSASRGRWKAGLAIAVATVVASAGLLVVVFLR